MSTSRCAITCSSGSRCTRTSNIDCSMVSGLSPCDIVRFPCGSRSMQSTRRPRSTSATPRLMVVVVFATPPFWFASAMTWGYAPPWPVAGARAERLLGEKRKLPPVERLAEPAVVVGEGQPRAHAGGEAAAQRVEPRRLTARLRRGDRQERRDPQRPEVEPLEHDRARGDGAG